MCQTSKEHFITKAAIVHSGKYDYSKVFYVNNKTKVIVNCPVHGEFFIRPDCHLYQSQGCKLCGIDLRSKKNKIPEEIFLKKSKIIHGDNFDYSQLNYDGMSKKIRIICKQCGDIFESIAYNHILGAGCRKCNGVKKLTTEEFISKSKEIHKDKFDYLLVNYTSCMEKVQIKCNVCLKIFEQKPNDHLGGHGCPHCSRVYPLNTMEFVNRSSKIHGMKYDYSKVNYSNNITKVDIFCKKCKHLFSQSPSHHLNGHGCPTCFSKIYRVSTGEKMFLDKMNIEKRQIYFGKICVDGYDPKTNTIYEFLGDYWHGNPEIFDGKMYNKSCHKTFGELYRETFEKFEKLKAMGFIVYYIWENEWNTYKNNGSVKLPLKRYL